MIEERKKNIESLFDVSIENKKFTKLKNKIKANDLS